MSFSTKQFNCSLITLRYVALSVCLLLCSNGLASTVRFETSLGSFDVRLFEDDAPKSVQNFMNYVNNGDYDNSIFHRSVQDFVVQGGGYKTDFSEIPAGDSIESEFKRSNVRGTIAMARTKDPNSATNQWFFNLGDNSGNLDNQNGGFTVFGEVVGNGIEIIDQIASLNTYGFAPPFTNLPLTGYSGTDFPAEPKSDNLVVLHTIQLVPEPAGYHVVALAFAGILITARRRVST